MKNSKKSPTSEELLRRIQELEERHGHIKQEIFKLTTSGNQPKPYHERINSVSPHLQAINGTGGVLERSVATVSSLCAADKKNHEPYLNIMQSIGHAVHIYDRSLRINCWNQAAENLYGYTSEEAYGKDPTELLVEPEDALYSRFLLKRTVNGVSWSGGFPVKNKWGEKLGVTGIITPLRDENERLIGAICMASDPCSYDVMNPGRIVSIRLGLDSQQPSITSKISTLALKVKLKMKAGVNYTDDELECESSSALFGEFFPMDTNEYLSGNITMDSGYKSANKHGSTMIEASSSTSSSSSSSMIIKSSKAIVKVERETDSLDYEILWEDLVTREQIGQGFCATVYRALWYGSNVAVKLFACQEYSDDVILSFKQEVSLMKRLRHPNILLFMGSVTSPHHLCIVTELLPRGSLYLILQRNTTQLDWRRRLNMAMDIARGMNYLHHCNPPIVHRDLKSSNLLVDKNWTVKVGDFGLSRIKHQTYLKTKTAKETVIGAVGFMNQRLEIPEDEDPLWASLIRSCWCSEPESRPSFHEILYKLKELQKKFAVERRR